MSDVTNDGGIEVKSPFEALKQVREESIGAQTADLAVPGYNGMLIARYHLLDIEDTDKIGKKVRSQFKGRDERMLWGMVDTIIQACDGLYFTEDGGETKKALDPYKTGMALTYEEKLGEFLNIDPRSNARQIVMGTFLNNNIAVMQHGMKLGRWFSDTSVDINQDFLGE